MANIGTVNFKQPGGLIEIQHFSGGPTRELVVWLGETTLSAV